MEANREEGAEFLESLEERILRAVELVAVLRKENEALQSKLEAAAADKKAAEESASSAVQEADALRKEIDGLRSERKQVRVRIEKLLGQMDALSAR